MMHAIRQLSGLALISSLGLIGAGCSAPDAATGGATTGAATTEAATNSVPTVTSPRALTSALRGGDQPEGRGPAPTLAGLVNADGSPFSLADLAGSDTLLFFGYTHCPDVCPATIGEILDVFKAFPETQAVFISVDPERDTPEFMAEWTQYFPDAFHGVSGSPSAIRRAADDFGVKYARVETASQAGYSMSHTADLFLIDEDGQLATSYPFGTTAAEIVEDLERRDAG